MGETAELLAALCFEVCPYRMPAWVKTIRRATHDEDHQGVDLVVEIDVSRPAGSDRTATGPTVGIQVKSSRKRADQFKKEHPGIPVLIVNPEDSEEYVRVKLLDLLRQERRLRLTENGQVPRRERMMRPREMPQTPLRVTLGDLLRR